MIKEGLFVVAAVCVCFLQTALGNQLECIGGDFDIASDGLFVDKVQPMYSKFWEVAYHGTYKILTNKASDLTYLLYQCGSDPPEEHLDGRHAAVLSIPIQSVAIASTPLISYMELLGLRRTIKGYVGNPSFISSPCLLELIELGQVSVADSAAALTGVDNDLVGLVYGWPTAGLAPNVVVEEYAERSFIGTVEWIKVYGALFNREQLANEIFDQVTCRIQEIVDNVANATANLQQRKPRILWAYYSFYCGGWDVAECPNYYCDFANLCKAEILHSSEGSVGFEICGAPYMSTEEFVLFGKDADHWIYPGDSWEDVYAANEAVLSTFQSVKSESVYDNQLGGGANAWFERRYAEYDVLLHDFCLVAGTIASDSNQRFWLRNVFQEEVGMPGSCEDVDAPLESRGNQWSGCGNTDSSTIMTAENETISEESFTAGAKIDSDEYGQGG
ncbi:expressed unknown protein [Seminavis robusta]|uniref:Uncharacterized protein n=1 Tax=Seminavis robusta TaxID=568900 RepID=A0A9N8HDF6_9STRA|nr:expressed unknown protein [Seminavis robusta]|eukprot:Sro341_g121600.1 n/a (445) ;mRNA; f:66935-68269